MRNYCPTQVSNKQVYLQALRITITSSAVYIKLYQATYSTSSLSQDLTSTSVYTIHTSFKD